jgi:pimeloyl-ACP methyl ester carboxylesterase
MAEAYADIGDITLCYETLGDPSDPTLLLLMGLGGQLVEWPDDFCHAFVERGFHVVRFDNRDAGLSSYLPEPVDLFEVLRAVGSGEPPEAPYLLSDMACDTVGLLDHLGVDRAHLLGISLGGMIAQTMALEHGDRVASLTSIMSTPGPEVSPPTSEALNALLSPPAETSEQKIAMSVTHAGIWGSPGLYDEEEVRERAALCWDRNYDGSGSVRQFAAIVASGNRTERLRSLQLPTLVLHGTADTLVPPAGGEATAAAIPGAELLIIEGMGHDLAKGLLPRLVEAIAGHLARHPIDDRGPTTTVRS